MDKNYTRQYLKEIWEQALQESLTSLEVKGERTKLIIQLVLASVILGGTFAFSFLGIKGYQNVSNVITATAIGTVVPSVIIFLGLLYGARIIALGNVFRAAAQRDYKQKEQFKELMPSDPLEFVLKPPYRLENGIVWIGIDIYNNSTHSVNCSASVKTQAMQRPNLLEPLSNHPELRNPQFQISRMTNFPFYFACSAKGWECAVLNTSFEPARRIYPGSHELFIIVNGEGRNNEPISRVEKFILLFDGDDNISLKVAT